MSVYYSELLQGLKELQRLARKGPVLKGEHFSFAERLDDKFKKYLEYEPDNTDAYILFAIFSMNVFHDEDAAITICEKSWSRHKDERALIIIAYILDAFRGGVSQQVFNKMIELQLKQQVFQSCLYMYCGLFLDESNDPGGMQLLHKSIQAYPKNVQALVSLSRSYAVRKDEVNKQKYINVAISSVKTIANFEDILATDSYTIDHFFDEAILWRYCTEAKYDHIVEMRRK